MKKPQLHILTAITLAFAAFTLGLYLGRNDPKSEISLSVPPELTAPRFAAVETVPETTAAEETRPEETTSETTAVEENNDQ